MNIISLFSYCTSNKKGWCARSTVFIPVFVALMSGLLGSLSNLANSGNGSASIWEWLTGSHVPQVAHFISDKTATRLVDLKGEWRFATGDDPARAQAAFDDSTWKNIKVPSYWEKQSYKNYDGYAWYRRDFSFSETAGPLYLMLGRVDDTDEVFINGRRVGGEGRFPPNYASAWNRERVYRLPDGVLRAGDNVIAIRVYDDQQAGGITGKQIGLYTTTLPQPIVDLSGEWKFRTGNDPDWKSQILDESGFGKIRVPSEWGAYGYANYDGHGWYRKTFGRLPVPADETLVLFLGKIDDTDEVFLNGERIGQTGFDDYKDEDAAYYYRMNREYEFPATLLKDTNTLAVHVYDGQREGGIYSGPIGIMTKTDYLARQKQIAESRKWHLDKIIDWLLGRE